MSIVKSQSPTKNSKMKGKEERIVHRLTSNVLMKFKPEKMGVEQPGRGIMGSIKSLGKYFPFRSSRQTEAGSEGSKIVEDNNFEELRFLASLDPDSYLIGNKDHIDAFNMVMVDDYIEVDHLWTLKLKNPILHLIVDPKRRIIVLITPGEIHIFAFEGRRSKNTPHLLKTFKITEEVKFIQFAKDMLLAVFFEKCIHFYALDGENSRQISRKEYKIDHNEYQLYQAAQCVEGILNIFFVGPKNIKAQKGEQEKDNFGLYCLPIWLINFEMDKLKHCYDIKKDYRSTLKVESVDKECFLLNLGREIMMFKRGYLVDSVAVNYQVNNTFVKYFSDRKAIHVSPSQIDFYNVIIDLAANPPKISLKSTDSLVTAERGGNYQFMDVLRFQQNKWGVFYQLPPPNLSGQIKYEFALTIQWDFNAKVDCLLPKVKDFKGQKNIQNPEFQKLLDKIKQRYDMVSKMGMTRKEAYLWIWKQSSKKTIQEFNLLLDTHDYETIREEITTKLKSKMMQWGEVHKMEQGCLSMLSDNLFSQTNYTEEGFKNFLISHMLVRKLELFKEIKLYEKQTGKIKAVDLAREKDKLMINIQEYTNTFQMDVRAYLLEMVYNFCKFKKDVLKEIRMVIRKFKFSFRHVYLTLLKEIVSTAKDELLYLLQNMPELLPYDPNKSEHSDTSLLYGVYGELKEEDWDRGLTLGQVMTVFNREMVLNFKNSIWIQRNWLSYHDMIFMTRVEIEEQFAKDKEKVFYCFLQQVFEENLGLEGKQVDLVNFLQDQYESFPVHLYSNVPLYRKLFVYFRENKFMHDSFQDFLKKKDHEIFKQIFDHQKYKKGSLLKEIKPIYEELGRSQKFNYGLLKFFSSHLSQVSDIKYLLNRINNQKREFHAENEEMYEVLIKGMQIKLKLGSQRDIPIEEVLIYLTKIPLKEGNVLQQQLRVLQEINKLASEFKKMKLDMSVFEIIRNRDAVLMKAIRHEIQTEKIHQLTDLEEIAKKSQSYLKTLSLIRQNIYGSFEDNDLLFMYLVTLLEKVQMTFCVNRLIQDNAIKPFGVTNLESVVYYCYKKKTTEQPKYSENQHYIQAIAELLPQDNTLRMFIDNEVKLVQEFTNAGLDMVYPISGSNGVISKYEIYNLMDSLSIQGLRSLNLQTIQDHVSKIQALLKQSPLPLTLYDLREKMVTCLLQKGLLKEALNQIQILISLDSSNEGNIIYLLLVYRQICCQFVQENKNLMLSLISKMFFTPSELLKVFQDLTSKELSNDEQKDMLMTLACGIISSPESIFDLNNMLFDQTVRNYLKENLQNTNEFQKLLRYQLNHLIKSNDEFYKSIDFPIFHMFILQRPVLFFKYISKAKYSINIREVRCFLSFLSKYQIFDQLKVLEYSKRLFKALYDSQRDSVDISLLIQAVFSTPLSEVTNVDILPADSDNLSRLSKAVEKFKGKIKSRMSSSIMKKKQSEIKSSVPPKYTMLQESFKDYNNYALTSDYPYNDSDGYIEKLQFLLPVPYKQPPSTGTIYDYRKYLRWLLIRAEQNIEHYLIKTNQSEADQEMKKIEEALKMSFRRSPYDKTVRDMDKPIVKMFSQTQRMEEQQRAQEVPPSQGLNLPFVSAIPNVQSSAVSEGANWLEEVAEVDLAPTILKDNILSTLELTEDGKVVFKVDLLRNYGSGHELDRVLPDTLKQIYNDEKLEYPTAILLIKEIFSFFPKLTLLSEQYIQIYSKIDQLQRKLSFGLPVRTLLPFEGLRIKEKDKYALFEFIKDKIQGYLDENNVHTLSRIISLAFKKPEYQQAINNEFLQKQIKQLNSVQDESLDERMKIEKIVAFAQKMPVALMKMEFQKMMNALGESRSKKTKVANEMVKLLRQKNDAKGAQQFELKWLSGEQQ